MAISEEKIRKTIVKEVKRPYHRQDLGKMRTASETVEKADFGSLVLLRDPNFVVCPI